MRNAGEIFAKLKLLGISKPIWVIVLTLHKVSINPDISKPRNIQAPGVESYSREFEKEAAWEIVKYPRVKRRWHY